jgi:predicted peptidase
LLIEMKLRITSWLLGCSALCASTATFAIKDDALGKYWTPDAQKVPYRAIQTPGANRHQRIPLIIFLHGDYQDGTDNQSQLGGYGNGSMKLIDEAIKAKISFVYIAPETTKGYWPPARIAAVVHDALQRFPIDARRVIVTGISDGATGVWDALKAAPNCYAAGVPMSGMTELSGLAPIIDIPQWIFHGGKDNDTNIETGYGGAMVGSRAVVRAMRAMGGKPRYTEYPNEMHVIWSHAYAEKELLPWMLQQRLPGKPCDFSSAVQGGAKR